MSAARRDSLHRTTPTGGDPWRLALLLFTLTLALAAPALAQSDAETLDDGSILIPVAEEPPPPLAEERATVQTAIVVFGAALALLLPMLLILLYSFYRQRPTPSPRSARARPPRRAARPAHAVSHTSGTSWTRATTSTSADASGGASNVEAPAQPLVGSSLDLDPHPAEPLLTDRLDTGVSGRSCPGCERIYDVGVEFCIYDGAPLEAMEGDVPCADPATHVMACASCGAHYEPGSVFCPEDGARLRPDDPDAPGFVAIPVVICTSCQREFPAGPSRCPDDGAPLLPLAGRRTSGISLKGGLGPRSRICPECGARYSDEAQFCGRDGQHLVSLN